LSNVLVYEERALLEKEKAMASLNPILNQTQSPFLVRMNQSTVTEIHLLILPHEMT
jgi:hypothetical protein